MKKKDNYVTKNIYQTSNTFKSNGGEKNSGKSITVQNEAYTIKELLEKHTQGLMPSVGLNPQYDHEEATHDDDITHRKPNLDLTDIDELKTKVNATKEKISKSENLKKQKALKAKKEKEEKEIFDRLSAEKANDKTA